MEVREAWKVWITFLGSGGHASSVEEGLQVEQAKRTLFHSQTATPELWQAAVEDSVSDLAVTLKAALQDKLQSLRRCSSSSQQLPIVEDVTYTTLRYLHDLLGWRAEQQWLSGAQDWCSERWRPLVDSLLGWAPHFFGQCLDHFVIAAPLAAQPSHSGYTGPPPRKDYLEEEAMGLAVGSCLMLLAKLLMAGAGAWTRPHSLLDALSAWLQVAVAWGRRCDTLKECYGWAGPAGLAGRFEVSYFLPLLVVALCGQGRGFRKSMWAGRVAQLLAKDRKLAVDLVRRAVLPALEGKARLGEEITWALQVLGCHELQPALVQAVIADAGLQLRLLNITGSGAWLVNHAWFEALQFYCDHGESGEHGKLTAMRPAVEVVQVYWQYSVLLLRLQQGLVSQGLDNQAKEVQRACYVALSAAHEGLAATVEALLAAYDAEESNSSDQADWQPDSEPEELLWQLAVACRGALENFMHVSTADRYAQQPAGYYEPYYTPKERACGEEELLLASLRAAGFCLSAGLHPLWRSLWSAMYATAQQEPGLQVEHGLLGQESAAAEQAAEDRVLLALQYHLERLAKQPVSNGELHQVLLNLVSIQKDAVLRLAKSGRSNLIERSSLLSLHLGILTALMPAVCQPAAGVSKPTIEGCIIRLQPLQADYRQLQGAAFQATFSLAALCECFLVLDRATIGWDRSAHDRIVGQAVQRVRDALSVTQQAAAVGAMHFLAYTGLVPLISDIFDRLLEYVKQDPAWGTTLLAHAEVLLGHLSGCISTPAVAVCVVMGGFGPKLAFFLVKLLQAVKAATTEQPALLFAMQRLQKLGCQLVRTGSQAVDELAGTDMWAVERGVEDRSNATLRQLLLEGATNARAAAVEAALRAWLWRLNKSLPALTVVARAHINSLLGTSLAPEATTGYPSNDAVRVASSVAAVQRELAVSSVLACARPWCSGRTAAFNRGSRLRLCAGCRGVRYCSEECAKQDWERHRPCCKALQRMSRG